MSLPEFALIAVVGLLAGVVNTLAGGGSLLTLPVLIFLGLPPTVANGTNRVGVFVQSATASWGFWRERDKDQTRLLDLRAAAGLLVPCGAGAALGSILSVDVDEAFFKQLIACAMLLMAVVMVFKPKAWLEGGATRKPTHPLSLLALFGVGFYGGFLQAGVGFFLLASIVMVRGADLVRANALKVALVFAFTGLALGVFVFHDKINWPAGLALAVGSSVGGWLGSKVAARAGSGFVRWVVVSLIVVAGGKMLYDSF